MRRAIDAPQQELKKVSCIHKNSLSRALPAISLSASMLIEYLSILDGTGTFAYRHFPLLLIVIMSLEALPCESNIFSVAFGHAKPVSLSRLIAAYQHQDERGLALVEIVSLNLDLRRSLLFLLRSE